jgi:hypothetical protein
MPWPQITEVLFTDDVRCPTSPNWLQHLSNLGLRHGLHVVGPCRGIDWMISGSAVLVLYGADLRPNDLDVVPSLAPLPS